MNYLFSNRSTKYLLKLNVMTRDRYHTQASLIVNFSLVNVVLLLFSQLSHVQLLTTSWTAAHQALLSSTISQGLLKFMSFESVMLPNHLILCCPFSFCFQSFPVSASFPMSHLFTSGGQALEFHHQSF